ncbi:MAG: preprotein translocase subunit YajC [Alphaproteobacteria bacterium]|nr:preprotein translocase subunit YajC [Alphaproteobacteria bacterium]
MLISQAWAQEATEAAVTSGSITDFYTSNILLFVIIFGLFYLLMVMPQQKRFKKHRDMLSQLKKGDKVIFAGGLVGTIAAMKDGEDQMTVELSKDVKITALRSTIQSKVEKEEKEKK